MIKKTLKYILPKAIYSSIQNFYQDKIKGYSKDSYSQDGEDLLLDRLFGGRETGLYIDVGAHHPKRFSNTYFFYRKGWQGINIDAMPGSMDLFKKHRKRDINIEAPISDRSENLTFYVFNDYALNTFSRELAVERSKLKGYFITSEVQLTTKRLDEVLDQNLLGQKDINFLSIDAEGFDFKVLRSINLKKYRPHIILIELISMTVEEVLEDEIAVYLKEHDYILYSKTASTCFFICHDFAKNSSQRLLR